MERKELFYAVNPVFATAKGCLGLLVQTGLKDAEDLGAIIDTTVRGAANVPEEIRQTFMVSDEARYHIGNIMAEESGCDVIVDLPCGYVPRGLAITAKGRTFYGLDLPAVVEELEPAIRQLASDKQNELMHFCPVDATNYESLKAALEGSTGKICIIMDGLLGYFNQPELDAVCDNIRKLLSEHGGVWITGDKYSGSLLEANTYQALTGKDGTMLAEMMIKGGGKVADIPDKRSSFVDGTVEEVKQYFSDHGFDIKETSYAEKLPELPSQKDSPETLEKLRDLYKDIKLWTISVKQGADKANKESREFGFSFNKQDGQLICSIIGRLDTITATDLLENFQKNNTGDLTDITVNLAETEYISSAGLRVLLIMCKTLPDMTRFHLENASKDILDILEVTGFADIFGM